MRRRLGLPLACLGAALFAATLGACQNPTANASASTHKITFNANGGAGAMAVLSAAEEAEVTLTANAFTKDSYSFIGWATYPLATSTEYPDKASFTMGSSSVVLYAVWGKNCHTVTFNANGGSGCDYRQSIVDNATMALSPNTFTRSGYSFAGWATSANAGTAEYADKASFTMGASDVVLYAVWAMVGTPHIVVSGPVSLGDTAVFIMPYVSGKSSYAFGQVYGTGDTTSASVTLTISNTGTAPLVLSGSSPYVKISANSDNSLWLDKLSIPTPPKQTIPAGESVKCVIMLAGVSWENIGGRDYTATAKISSNDPDEPDFSLSLTGNIGC
jgi:uncharacterized repeat protein (TIGR02543 family)